MRYKAIHPDAIALALKMAEDQLPGPTIARATGISRAWVDRLINRAGLRACRDTKAIHALAIATRRKPERMPRESKPKPKREPAPTPSDPIEVDWTTIAMEAREHGVSLAQSREVIVSAVNRKRLSQRLRPMVLAKRKSVWS